MKRSLLEWAENVSREKFDYKWMVLWDEKRLDPVMGLEDSFSFGIPQKNGSMALVRVYDLKQDEKYLVVLGIYAPVVIQVGKKTKTLDRYSVPQIFVTDVISAVEPAMEYLNQPVDVLKKVDLEGDNYLARLLRNKKEIIHLPTNYQCLKLVIKEILILSIEKIKKRRKKVKLMKP